MGSINGHAVGLRELRLNTSEVLARVRHGETIDVTEYGQLIARITPVQEREPTSTMTRLVESGRARLAIRPGYRPRMHQGDGTDLLGDTLKKARAEDVW